MHANVAMQQYVSESQLTDERGAETGYPRKTPYDELSHTAKPENPCPEGDSNPHPSTAGSLGKGTS